MPQLSLSIGANGLEGQSQGEPLLALLSISLALQRRHEHGVVETHGLVVLSFAHTDRDTERQTNKNKDTHIHLKKYSVEVPQSLKAQLLRSPVVKCYHSNLQHKHKQCDSTSRPLFNCFKYSSTDKMPALQKTNVTYVFSVCRSF